MRFKTTLALAAGLMLSYVVPVEAGLRQENRAISEVEFKFSRLTAQGEWLGFNRGVGPKTSNPFPLVNSDQHYQGIQRASRRGTPYFYVTRSGSFESGEDNYGSLLVVGMGSRDGDGERLRSNRLAKGKETRSTRPSSRDRVIRNITFSNYYHPGGIQLVGDILAVPLEGRRTYKVDRCETEVVGSVLCARYKIDPPLPEGKVVFFDTSDRANPRKLPYELRFDHKVGVLGMTRLSDGHFLLALTWGSSTKMELLRSTHDDFLADGFGFEEHDTLSRSELEASGFWRTGATSPQSLNFVNQDDGRLFLIGSSNSSSTAPFGNGDDQMYLWEVTGFGAGEEIALQQRDRLRTKDLKSDGNPVVDPLARQEANFNAGAGVYISPTGELIYYAVEYYNKGVGESVRMAELRDRLISSTSTCGPQISADHLGGPYRIPESSILNIDGTVHVIAPWVQMYEDNHYRGKHVTMDFLDQEKDDYHDFKKLDGPGLGGANGFNDELTAYAWCGPPGSRLTIYDDDNFRRGNVPNRVHHGTGRVYTTPHVGHRFNDEATSARIRWPEDERGQVSYRWHTSGALRILETRPRIRSRFIMSDGPEAILQAGVGNSLAGVAMRFAGKTVTATVEVFNVPPVIDSAELSQAGNATQLRVSWSDPGRVDHTATIDWGDGTADENVDLGRSTGGVFEKPHVYANPGRFEVIVEVSDPWDTTTTTLVTEIRNEPPTVDLGDDVVIDEARTLELEARYADPDPFDHHRFEVDWGDGTSEPRGPIGTSGDVTQIFRHRYGDDGTYTVSVAVTDDRGETGFDQLQVEVRNLDPTIEIDRSSATSLGGGDALAASVGVEMEIEASAEDPGSDDLFISWKVLDEVFGEDLHLEEAVFYNDELGPDGLRSSAGAFPFSASDRVSIVLEPGLYAAVAEARDDDGGFGEDRLALWVAGDDLCTQGVSTWMMRVVESVRGSADGSSLSAQLALVRFASSIFSEEVYLETLEDAAAVLAGMADVGNADPEKAKAMQDLLTVWLNVASGSVAMDELLNGQTSVLTTLKLVEGLLADPDSTSGDWSRASFNLNRINELGCKRPPP